MFETVAIGGFEVDHHHIGRNLGDAPGSLVSRIHDRDETVPGLAESVLDDGGAQPVVIDDEDGKLAAVHGSDYPVASTKCKMATCLNVRQ